MAGFTNPTGSTHPTPGRTTHLVIDVTEKVNNRPTWSHLKTADQIQRYAPRGVTGTLVQVGQPDTLRLLPGPAWSLNPLRGENAQLAKNGFSDAVLRKAIDGDGTLNLPANFVSVPLQRAPSDLPGMGVLAGTSTLYGIVKRVPPAGDWGENDPVPNVLSPDAAAFSSLPNPTDQIVPLDRVASSRAVYPENSGFGLIFHPGHDFYGGDAILNFYWGGWCNVRPIEGAGGTRGGGEFGLQLRGNGRAILYERAFNGDWERRHTFRWAEPNQVADRFHTITILPYERHQIVFTTSVGEAVTSPSGLVQVGSGSLPGKPTETLYRENPSQTGHIHVLAMTGAGQVRLDVRRNLRTPWTIFRLKYPEDGILVDEPFMIDYPLPAGTPITAEPSIYDRLGGSVAIALYDAATDLPLAAGAGAGQFLSVANQQHYYARLTFNASADQYQSPILFSYGLGVAGRTSLRVGSNTTGGNIRHVSITGPGVDPTEETASIRLKDVKNVLTRLQHRDRIHEQTRVYHPDDPRGYTIIQEGQIIRPDGLKKGYPKKAGFGANGAIREHPHSDWRDYDPLKMIGMWGKIEDQKVRSVFDFREDHAVPRDANGNWQGWKVTDAMVALLLHCGFDEDQVDIPDLPIRFSANPGLTTDDFVLQVGKPIGRILRLFAVGLTGRALVWCANSEDYGMWRLLQQPQKVAGVYPDAQVKAEFNSSTVANRITYRPLSYGSPTITWIQGSSYHTSTVGPEFNFLDVLAPGAIRSDGAGRPSYKQVWWNKDSFNWDPDNPTALDEDDPDFIGYIVPEYIDLSWVRTPEMLAVVLGHITDLAGHGEELVQWRSPLLLIGDPTDTHLGDHLRPLRMWDLVKVRGRKAILKGVDPDYSHSGNMLANYSAKFVEPA